MAALRADRARSSPRTLGRSICYLTSSETTRCSGPSGPASGPSTSARGSVGRTSSRRWRSDVLVATVPQLGIPVLPRSQRAAAVGTQYVYVFHSMASTHMIYEPDGFDHYDTVCCVGPYMVEEIRRREELEGLPAKELVEHGYGRLDTILATPVPPRVPDAEHPTVLVAPSWGPTCIVETVGVDLVRALLDDGCRVDRAAPSDDGEAQPDGARGASQHLRRGARVPPRRGHRGRRIAARIGPDDQRLVRCGARVRVRSRPAGAVRRRRSQGQQPGLPSGSASSRSRSGCAPGSAR